PKQEGTLVVGIPAAPSGIPPVAAPTWRPDAAVYIEPNPTSPQHILSVRGTGYRFVGKPTDHKTGQ
ncbi:MAG: hypothetical protein ABGZ17_05065, partial [Planctomycetaceae bacterium]